MITHVDETHDPALSSWVDSANTHAEFPIQNLPFGIFSSADERKRAGVAIGSSILDLASFAEANPGLIDDRVIFEQPVLNALLSLPSDARRAFRRRLSKWLSDPAYVSIVEPHIRDASTCTMHMPAQVGNFTDFFVGIHHATNTGRLWRPDSPLHPNYKHIPVAYHGRPSSIRPSDIPVRRPRGQIRLPDREQPVFGPSRHMDFELELGMWVGPGSELGDPIPMAQAWDHVAGFCLLNDWSARDIQQWEYVPAGPFLGKNFHTTVSPWIVTVEALAPFRRPFPSRAADDTQPLPYLIDTADQRDGAISVELEVSLLSARMRDEGLEPCRITKSNTSGMYWSFAQILTHHASNGCNVSPGDLIGSGTLSLPDRGGWGCMLEISRGGADMFTLPNGETRTFLEDGDEICFTAHARAEGHRSIGFGTCRAVIDPAR